MVKLDTDPQALQKAIIECTLPDDYAMADLQWRAQLHAEADKNSPMYGVIAELIHDAIRVAIEARKTGKPIVVVLKKMLLDLGRLKAEAAGTQPDYNTPVIAETQKTREEAFPDVSAMPVGENSKSAHLILTNVSKNIAQTKHASSSQKGKYASSSQKGRNTIPSPSRLRSRSRSVSPSGGFGSLAQPSKQNRPGARNLAPPASSFPAALATSSRSSTASLETPVSAPKAAAPLQVSRAQRRARRQPISKEIVSDSDASDKLSSPVEPAQELHASGTFVYSNVFSGSGKGGKGQAAAAKMPTKVSKPALKRTRDIAAQPVNDDLDYVDLSDGLSGFKYRDENGSPAKRPHGRQAMINGIIKPALIVKLKISSALLQAQFGFIELHGKKRKGGTQPKTKEVKNTIVANKHQMQPALFSGTAQPATHQSFQAAPFPASQDTSLVFSPSLLTAFKISPAPPSFYHPIINDTDNTPTSIRPTLTPFSSPPQPSTVAFPPFPTLTAWKFPLWLKGLTIAVENIISDHEAHPTASVADILAELEDEAPTIPGDDRDRRVVMSGSQYVYDAVRDLLDGEKKEKKPAVGADADADGDVAMLSVEAGPMKKVRYKGKGRAWKKTEKDNDPDFRAVLKDRVAQMPERRMERRAVTVKAAADEAWRETVELFEEFRRHVRGEYQRCERLLGVNMEKEGLPKWLVE